MWTAHLTAGMGINPNNGANQPEFFLGLALGFNRFLIHPGVHFGRMQSLGGGFTPGTAVGSGITPPINWSYHAAFSIGFSVRERRIRAGAKRFRRRAGAPPAVRHLEPISCRTAMERLPLNSATGGCRLQIPDVGAGRQYFRVNAPVTG